MGSQAIIPVSNKFQSFISLFCIQSDVMLQQEFFNFDWNFLSLNTPEKVKVWILKFRHAITCIQSHFSNYMMPWVRNISKKSAFLTICVKKNVEASSLQFRPKISTPFWSTAFVYFSIDRKHFLYHLMISWLKTILILGSQIVETSVHGEHKVRMSQLIGLYLVNWELLDNCTYVAAS